MAYYNKQKITARSVIKCICIAVLCFVLIGAVVWTTGWAITGKINPADWKSDEAQQEELHIEHARHVHATSEDGIQLLSSIPECPSCGSFRSFRSTTATCTEAGEDLYFCNNEDCSADPGYKTYRAPLGHDYAKFVNYVTEPTCTTEGSALYQCRRSGCDSKETKSVPKIAHTYSWVITSYPEGDSAGIESYKCENCDDVQQTRSFFALPAEPEKEGFHFVGWYKDEALTTPYDSDYIYEDTNLYAKFEINQCTVTFDTDGGNAIDSVTVEWNSSVTLPAAEKTGYIFLGWFRSDGTQAGATEVIKGDTILTAHWQIKTFTVTFYVNGLVYTTVTVEYGSVLSKVANDVEVFASNIISFTNLNSDTPDVYATEMIVTDDMTVVAKEATSFQLFVSRYMPYIIGSACALVLIAVVVGVTVKKKRG